MSLSIRPTVDEVYPHPDSRLGEHSLAAACATAAAGIAHALVREVDDFEQLNPAQVLALDAWSLLSLAAERGAGDIDGAIILPNRFDPQTAEARPIRDTADVSVVVEARRRESPPTHVVPATGWPSPTSPLAEVWATHLIEDEGPGRTRPSRWKSFTWPKGFRMWCVVCATAVLAVGCSGANEPTRGIPTPSTTASVSGPSSVPPTSPTSASSAPVPSTPLPSAPTPTASGGSDADLLEEGGAQAAPTWDAASRASALQNATDLVTAFARPGLEQGQWWRDLAPRLTPNGRRFYATVDVGNVPAHKVTGAARLVDSSSPYLAGVEVPTDAGVYAVLLTRDAADSPWLGEQISPKGA